MDFDFEKKKPLNSFGKDFFQVLRKEMDAGFYAVFFWILKEFMIFKSIYYQIV